MSQKLRIENNATPVGSVPQHTLDIFTSLEMVRQILECQHFSRLHFARDNGRDGYIPYDTAIVDHARKQLEYAIKKFRETTGLASAVSPSIDGLPQFVDVRSGLKSASQLLRHRLEHALVVEWLPSDLPNIYVDPDEFREICYNLFLYCVLGLEGRAGRITVEAITQPPTASWPGGVRIRFLDSGPTIHEHHLHLIFNPSFFSEEPRRIDGLLLYITKRLAEKNHGRMTAYNCFGTSSAICVDFPSKTPIELSK